jgi:uncharacterized ferritin-like protein (DUF455 family)
MNILEYAKLILESPSIEDKMLDPSIVTDVNGNYVPKNFADLVPAREKKHLFSDKQDKFPKASTFHLDERKGAAIHFFANHELLAVEMMAAAILYLPVAPEDQDKVRRGLLATIKDEQKHFQMYLKRMRDFGVDFGDLSINDYFWRQMQKVKNYEQYFSVVALTFESANLDFAKYYQGIFEGVDDQVSARIMETVYEDEISHVALGTHWLNKWKKDKTLWLYYQESLPDFLTPTRAKGIIFDREGRSRAGLQDDFISQVENYNDKFYVTNRKEWK